jgi:cytochrome c5
MANPSVEKVPIKIWTSSEGGKKQSNILDKVDIGGLYFDDLSAFDIQYEKKVRLKGLKLRDLISQYSPIPEGVDYMLLHSKRGMIIPIPISELRSDTAVFIALAIFDEKSGKWLTSFPQSVYSQPEKGEQITLQFDNNKIVVGQEWRHTDFAITPWRFFDSLAGIEFVNSSKHYSTLRPSKGNDQLAGRLVFTRRCQYCHGIGAFGATFAPDLITLLPQKKDEAVKRIMTKVLPPAKLDFAAMPGGARMPKQEDFKENDAKALFDWIKAYGKNPGK